MEIDVLALLEAACNKRYRVTASPKCKIGFVISKCVIGDRKKTFFFAFKNFHFRCISEVWIRILEKYILVIDSPNHYNIVINIY